MANKKPHFKKETHSNKSSGGFTIIELMIATSVFSVVLLLVSMGIIKIGHTYYKGIIEARTQETARNISTDVSQTLQFANGQKKPGASLGSGVEQFCIGNTRYTAFLNKQVKVGVDGLKSEKMNPSDACNDTNPLVGTEDKEMLGNNMRLLRFNVDPADALSRTWKIDVRLAYGDNDLFSHYQADGVTAAGWDGVDVKSSAVDNANCKSGIAGGSFCATSQLDIIVKKRLN